MITETLHIRFTAAPIHEPRAWFLPGHCAVEWLAKICTWDIPHSRVRLLIVPHSRQDLRPIGVLVVVDSDPPISKASRNHPYGQLAGRLYLPVEARLEPAVDESELQGLLTKDCQYVWHPTAGLIGFDPADVLTVSDLLLPLSRTNGNWEAADPGIAFARRLVSIEAIQPLSVEEFLQSGQDDIGTEADALDELPPSPEEEKPASPFQEAMSAPMRPIAKFIKWITSRAPNSAAGGTWIDRLKNWANHVLSPEQQSARLRELARLLNMLKNDPDMGLKYALPMGGDAARGIAPPSRVLSTHDVDFRFPSSGGPADYWHIPPETLFQLTARYRELAEREIRLGRYRRAAYIYAELLGEMESAAAALKSGGYYREAAAVYEERLNRPHDEAACLEEGGLWNEAIERYKKLGEFEKCGAIYRRLDQHDQADKAYRKAAAACCMRGDLLRAAKLYDEECGDPDQALTTLRHGWPATNQSQECLRAEFRLLGREGRHAEAGKRVQELIGTSLRPQDVLPMSEVLAEAAGDYPDETVRATAVDGTRVIVSQRLIALREGGPISEDRRLLRTIEKLAPEDRLLHRDCERYLREGESLRWKETHVVGRASVKTKLVSSVQLPSNVNWCQAEASNRYYFAVGFDDGKLVLARGKWNSITAAPELLSWTSSPVLKLGGILLAPSPNDTHDVWMQLQIGPPLPPRRFPGTGQQCVVTPPWTTRDTVALAQTANGVSWTVSGKEMLILSVYSANHVPIITRQLSVSAWDGDSSWGLPIHARSEGVFFGLHERLVFLGANNRDGETRLEGRITRLSGSATHSRVRVAASFEEGGVVIWKDTERTRQFGHDLNAPWTTFTVTGKLIAVDESKIEVYSSARNTLSIESTITSPGEPLSVMPVGRDSFAVLCSGGRLNVYQVTE